MAEEGTEFGLPGQAAFVGFSIVTHAWLHHCDSRMVSPRRCVPRLLPSLATSDLLVSRGAGGLNFGCCGGSFKAHRSLRDHLPVRSEEHTSELQSLRHLVCRLLLEK